MSEIKFRRKEGLQWELIHADSGIILSFTEGLFNETQQVSNAEGKGYSAEQLATIMREIGDFAGGEDFQFISMCYLEGRHDLLDFFSHDLLKEACEKFAGYVSPELADEYAFEEEFLPYLETQNASEELKEACIRITNDEMIELFLMVDAYWLSPYDIEQWANDYADWLIYVEADDE